MRFRGDVTNLSADVFGLFPITFVIVFEFLQSTMNNSKSFVLASRIESFPSSSAGLSVSSKVGEELESSKRVATSDSFTTD